MILSILNLVRFILGSRCGLSLFMFHGHLARACLRLFLCGMFRKCGLDSVGGVNESSVSLLVLCLPVLSAGKVGAEASVRTLRLSIFLASPWFYFTRLVAHCRVHTGTQQSLSSTLLQTARFVKPGGLRELCAGQAC